MSSMYRYNRMKLDRLQKDKEEKDFEKVYKQNYWSYSKSMIKQPLTVIEGPDLEETAIKMFYSLQHHAGESSIFNTVKTLKPCYHIGIVSGDKSGFELDYEDAATLVQVVVAKCIEKEALCNEFYLQLIKQTTDQPGNVNH